MLRRKLSMMEYAIEESTSEHDDPLPHHSDAKSSFSSSMMPHTVASPQFTPNTNHLESFDTPSSAPIAMLSKMARFSGTGVALLPRPPATLPQGGSAAGGGGNAVFPSAPPPQQEGLGFSKLDHRLKSIQNAFARIKEQTLQMESRVTRF